MNVSGVLVVAPADRLDAVGGALSLIAGVDVHHVHAETGRLVATIEAETVDEEVQILRRIKTLDGVILAEMVHHHFEDNPVVTPDSETLPAMLRDDIPYEPENNRKNRRSIP